MKRWPVVILVILLVLGAVVLGCRHVPQYDSRLTAADVNCDGNVTINDVTTLINILLQNGQINETDLESDM